MINKNTLYFYLLNSNYFEEYQNLDEFQEDNSRGHGVIVIDINDLIIAVPLRSGINAYLSNSKHIFKYTEYLRPSGRSCIKALDFSKITIIEEKYINKNTTYIFKDENERQFYLKNFNRIYTRINNYVKAYKNICYNIEVGKRVYINTLKPYKFSTLRNFHSELDINITKEQFIEVLEENGLIKKWGRA